MSATPFRSAFAAADTWQAAVQACAAGLLPLPPAPPEARFGLIYVTDGLAPHLGAAVEALRAATGVDHWAGCVGAGVAAITPAFGAGEAHGGLACAALVGTLEPGQFALQTGIRQPEEAPAAAPAGWPAPRPWLGLMHGDPRNSAVPGLISLLPEVCDSYLVGGLTADTGPAAQVIGQGVTGGGLSGLWFSGAVPVAVGLTQGCRPLGPPRVITAMEGDWIAALDRKPAVRVLLEELAASREATSGDPLPADALHVAIPVDASDTGDYLVRNLLALDANDGRLAVAADMVEGERLLFVRRDPAAAAEDLRRMLRRVLGRAGQRRPRGAVYVSCLARGPHLFGPSGEIALVREELGDIPLAGFFANGEINRDRLYAYTGVLILFLDDGSAA